MGPRDDERRLAEIRQHLVVDDPGLARVLATGRLSASREFAVVLGGGLAAGAAGLVLLLMGTQLASVLLMVVGGTCVVMVPGVLVTWRFRRRRAR